MSTKRNTTERKIDYSHRVVISNPRALLKTDQELWPKVAIMWIFLFLIFIKRDKKRIKTKRKTTISTGKSWLLRAIISHRCLDDFIPESAGRECRRGWTLTASTDHVPCQTSQPMVPTQLGSISLLTVTLGDVTTPMSQSSKPVTISALGFVEILWRLRF